MTSMRISSGPIELRLPELDDDARLFALASDPDLTRFLQWPTHRTTDDSRSYIVDARALWARRVALLPCIYRTSDDELLGAIGVSHIDRPNARAEVGTWLGTGFQRQGFNLPAKAAIFRFAFEVLGLHRLELLVRTDNAASLRSMERLPGVQHEGVARMRIRTADVSHDAHTFAITSADWEPAAWPDVRIEGGLP